MYVCSTYITPHWKGECTILCEYRQGQPYFATAMAHQVGKQGKRWLIRSSFFTVHLLHSNSLRALLIGFIKSLILLSTWLEAEKPLMHGTKGKPSAETKNANLTAQPGILRAKTMFLPLRRASTFNKLLTELSLAVMERWKELLRQGPPEHRPGSSLSAADMVLGSPTSCSAGSLGSCTAEAWAREKHLSHHPRCSYSPLVIKITL